MLGYRAGRGSEGAVGAPHLSPAPGASGGIGRRAGFRILWEVIPWGFESPLAHACRRRPC